MAQAKDEPKKTKANKSHNQPWPKATEPLGTAKEDEGDDTPPRSTEADINYNDRPKIPRDN
jgi:hypothetical protein